ncbi:unnamed protein product [Caenorhabditis bovis]|uniref:t-SNARE coiled-coil homology domain-containing protein n=1 Tax=Caenorhabditis bovis TaxID=2654633 RepID=A0A8S1F573_9PELO|nr:unnamed protein product [Caenorhabditis bovis]
MELLEVGIRFFQGSRNDSFDDFLIKDREDIKSMHRSLLITPGNDAVRTKELHDNVGRFIQRAKVLRDKFAKLNESVMRIPDSGYGSARARREQIRVLNMTFEAIVTHFNEDQVEYKEKAACKISEYLKLQNIEVSDDQIDDAIESGNLGLLTKNIHLGIAQKKALFEDVKQRACEILELEKQIREIDELVCDLHLLVSNQGETIDRIETSVNNASEYTKKARVDVRTAVVSRRRNRKFKCLVLILAICLITFAGLLIKELTCIYTPLC